MATYHLWSVFPGEAWTYQGTHTEADLMAWLEAGVRATSPEAPAFQRVASAGFFVMPAT